MSLCLFIVLGTFLFAILLAIIHKNMTTLNIPDTDHVMRYVAWGRLRKDANNNVLGILAEAFKLRSSDNGALSVNWLEHFGGDKNAQIQESVATFHRTLKVGGNSRFGVGNVGKIKEICELYDNKIRVVHEPETDNQSHSAIRGLLQDNGSLLDEIAADAFAELISNTAVIAET